MNSVDDILNAEGLSFEGDFDTQVDHLMYNVRLTPGEVSSLRHLIDDLERALRPLGHGIEVMPFGSIVTGLGIKTSDVDCFVRLPDGMVCHSGLVIHARNLLRKHYRKFANPFAIVNAQVPIVKFLYLPANCNCDINFKSPAGVYNSDLIGTLLRLDGTDRALRLAIIIKYWSKVHKITGTNLLASYALTMMVIFYLQLMNILPPIAEIQKDVPPFMIDGWNMAFNRNVSVKEDNHSLYELLGGFFKCYSTLNFQENVISPYLGRLLNKKLFNAIEDVPNEFQLYKEKLTANICKPLKLDSQMCVQDPFEHSRNTTGSVFPKLATRLNACIQFGAQKYEELPPEDFLRAIFIKYLPEPVHKNKKPQKHVFQNNKVMKPKQAQNKPKLQNTFHKCYEQINAIRKNKQK